MRATPSRLMTQFVTRPASSSVMPSERTIGHDVGVGRFTTPLWSCPYSDSETDIDCLSSVIQHICKPLSSKYVDNSEHHNPYRIDEVPVERKHIHAMRMLFIDMASQGKDQGGNQHQQTDDDVGRMKTDERIEGSAKQVRLNRQVIDVDEVVPLHACSNQKDGAKSDRRCKPCLKRAHAALSQRGDGPVQSKAARQQA